MIGVILWTDPTDKTAVIWCEDQGELAYLSREEALATPDPFFDVGDLVEFDVRLHRRARHAVNTTRLVNGAGAAAVSALKQSRQAPHTPEIGMSAQIIPFQPARHIPAASDHIRKSRRG